MRYWLYENPKDSSHWESDIVFHSILIFRGEGKPIEYIRNKRDVEPIETKEWKEWKLEWKSFSKGSQRDNASKWAEEISKEKAEEIVGKPLEYKMNEMDKLNNELMVEAAEKLNEAFKKWIDGRFKEIEKITGSFSEVQLKVLSLCFSEGWNRGSESTCDALQKIIEKRIDIDFGDKMRKKLTERKKKSNIKK